MAAVVVSLFISIWWSSGLITVKIPCGFLDEELFFAPIVKTAVKCGRPWFAVWIWS